MTTTTTIGRPNVGKSTVVNRLARRFKDGSIVHDEAGVTRDRTYKRAWYCGKDYDIIDTGGLVFDDTGDDVFAKQVRYRRACSRDHDNFCNFTY